MSIELPATSRHRRDITERLLKATLSQNQTKNTFDIQVLKQTCRTVLRGLYTFTGEATLYKMFCFATERKEFACRQESIPEVTKVVFLMKMAEYLTCLP